MMLSVGWAAERCPECERERVECDPIETDRYGRTVAVCRLGSLDLNEWLVEQGFGLAYRKYLTAYVAQEDAARTAKRGMWQEPFVEPWDWRKGDRIGPEDKVVSPEHEPALATSRETSAASVSGSITCRARALTRRR